LSLSLREEHRLRAYENGALRRIFGLNRGNIIEGSRKPQNKELHNLYCSLDIIRMIKSWRMRWAGHVARIGEKRNACRILVRTPDGKGPLGRLRRSWDYNNIRSSGKN
jgi:hypothetical protein